MKIQRKKEQESFHSKSKKKMQDLKVTLIQTELYWENPVANLAMLEEKIAQIEEETDLIVLPEMFSTAFSMNTTLAEPMNLTTFKWMKQQAAQTKAVILGSVMIREGEKVFNRMIWMQPDGQFQTYDKRHLFRMGAEHEFYQSGDEHVIVSYKGWNLALFVCYDLRFPVWSRNVGMAYDAAIYVANWPAPRANAWRTLLQARAIENLAYVVGVNRVGTDANNLSYAGDSLLVDFKGGLQLDLQAKDQILTSELSAVDLADFRAKFPAHLDADLFSLSSL